MKTEKEVRAFVDRLMRMHRAMEADDGKEMLSAILALLWVVDEKPEWGKMVGDLWREFIARAQIN